MKNHNLSKALRFLRPYWLWLALSVLLALLTVAGTLSLPVLAGNAIDLLVEAGQVNFAALAQLLIPAAILAAATAAVQWLMGLVNNRVVYRVVRDLRTAVFNHVQTLPLSYLDQHPAGDLVSRIIADADQFADGLLLGFNQLFTGVMTIGFTLVLMFRIRWQVALVVMLLTPVSLLIARFIGSRTFHLFKKRSETTGEQTALLDEYLGNQKLVQAFGQETATHRSFTDVNTRLRDTSLKAIFFSSLVNPTTRFAYALVYALVALVGTLTVISDPLFTVGSLTTLLAYTNQYTKPFNEISGVITELQNSMACASRIFELLEQPSEPEDGTQLLEQVGGTVELHDVSFSYSVEKPLIEHLNLNVKPGQRVAIVGPTGCGKTTLINLLMRFYDVNGGEIRIDGKPIRELQRKSLRSAFGMVLQDTWLRNDTVMNNLKLGKPDATDEQVIAAAKASHADAFIRRLPQGYETVLTDSGSLSQGQKQLLCIARVMLCLPPMMILDEATSSIDTRTEQSIQSAFAQMMQGRTCFIVAHRLSTIQNADLILVMKDGKVIEQGDHKSLLKRNGFYARLYSAQFEQ